ncbi:MAG TPA: response regulator [Pirellulales bacterium]|jgi:two-component system chemotaxis response regulator CheY|nr:response regulator [Pirellulales bacterium]
MTKRVLVVDDALIMRLRIKEIAQDAGWEIAGEADNGEAGLALYRELRPDLTTLDIVMPKMDGVSALRQIRAEDPQAKVVMVSAVDQKAKLTECIGLGALDFIVKPFDKARLKSFFTKYGRPEPSSETGDANLASPPREA